VALAGGLPFILPSAAIAVEPRDFLDGLDGLLLSGGGDVSPLRYGEEPIAGLGTVSKERDDFEIALAQEARRRGMPILGICRGHQLLNVALGGTLYQDIPSQVEGAISHQPPEGQAVDEFWHSIDILPASRYLEASVEGKFLVNSFHHQAVKSLAEGLVETARSADGLIEAFESVEGSWILGIQFHPETLTARHPAFVGIFVALVRAAASWAAARPSPA